jgi:hypothetical protein
MQVRSLVRCAQFLQSKLVKSLSRERELFNEVSALQSRLRSTARDGGVPATADTSGVSTVGAEGDAQQHHGGGGGGGGGSGGGGGDLPLLMSPIAITVSSSHDPRSPAGVSSLSSSGHGVSWRVHGGSASATSADDQRDGKTNSDDELAPRLLALSRELHAAASRAAGVDADGANVSASDVHTLVSASRALVQLLEGRHGDPNTLPSIATASPTRMDARAVESLEERIMCTCRGVLCVAMCVHCVGHVVPAV